MLRKSFCFFTELLAFLEELSKLLVTLLVVLEMAHSGLDFGLG